MVRMNPPSDTIEAVDRVYVVEFGEVSFVAIAEVFVHRDMWVFYWIPAHAAHVSLTNE